MQTKKCFTDYKGFIEKFKTKQTTDDCYTPPEVYDTVLQWLRENADIEGREIVCPFLQSPHIFLILSAGH